MGKEPCPTVTGPHRWPKPPLRPREVWSIRTRLQVSGAARDLALFNLPIDSKFRGCDLVAITVGDIALSGSVRDRAVIVERKTGRPVQFEITEQTRAAAGAWITSHHLTETDFLFPVAFELSRICPQGSTGGSSRSGFPARARPEAIRNAFDETHEGLTDLQGDRHHSRSSAATRSYQAGEHRALPRHRTR